MVFAKWQLTLIILLYSTQMLLRLWNKFRDFARKFWFYLHEIIQGFCVSHKVVKTISYDMPMTSSIAYWNLRKFFHHLFSQNCFIINIFMCTIQITITYSLTQLCWFNNELSLCEKGHFLCSFRNFIRAYNLKGN